MSTVGAGDKLRAGCDAERIDLTALERRCRVDHYILDVVERYK
jgi:hypothetical protein